MLLELLHILRNANLQVTPIEVAEALLLARFLPSVSASAKTPVEETPQPQTNPEPKTAPALPPESAPKTSSQEPEPPALQPGDAVLPPTTTKETGSVTAVPFRSPQARALPAAHKIGTALRPLRRHHLSAQRVVMNEEATVQQIADGGPKTIVWQPARERWLSVELVLDESISMHIWRPTLREFRALLERHGAFRNVRLWQLNTDENQARLSRLIAHEQRPAHPPQLLAPMGRQLIIVVSDCTAKAWYHGSAYQMLTHWARQTPTVLTQVLPRSLWLGTSMTEADATMRADQPGLPNHKLRVQPNFYAEWLQTGAPLPIVTLDEWSIAPWAKMVSGFGQSVASGLVLPDLTEALAQNKPLPAPTRPVPAGAAARVESFLATASPLARQLARYLAVAPLSLPVLQLVQQAMLPQSRQSHLAEIFRSDLMDLPAPPITLTEETIFDFHDGVREELLRDLTRRETLLVLDKVADFIFERSGQARNLQALMVVPGGKQSPPDAVQVDPLALSFARIGARTLRKLRVRTEQAEQWETFVKRYDPNLHVMQMTLDVLIEPETVQVPDTPPEEIKPGSQPNDPWKGVFGGQSERNHRRLSATIGEVIQREDDLYDWHSLTLAVSSTDPSEYPLQGSVQFYLHDSFEGDNKPVVTIGRNLTQAVYRTTAWGAFTVGAIADDGATRLELDLAEQSDLPHEFRYPLSELLKFAASSEAGFTAEASVIFAKHIETLALDRQLQTAERRARVAASLGKASAELGNDPLAIQFLAYALARQAKVGDNTFLDDVLSNLGTTHHRSGALKVAREYFERRVALAREARDELAEGRSLLQLARLDQQEGRIENSISNAERARDIVQKIRGATNEMIEAQELITQFPTSSRQQTEKPLKVFVSYSYQDLALKEELDKHLTRLKRQGRIEVWDNKDLRPDVNEFQEISARLSVADIVLMLVSSDYLKSSWCQREMQMSLELARKQETRMLPIILSPCDWLGTPLAQIQGLPRDPRPVTTFTNRDDAWADIALRITTLVSDLTQTPAPKPEPQPEVQPRRQHYDCLLAYSQADTPFALHLYLALKDKGINCLFDKPFEEMLQQAERYDRVSFDKELLCLSSHSMDSDWMRHEIESGLGRFGETVVRTLIPLVLDDSLPTPRSTGWLARIQKTISSAFQAKDALLQQFWATHDPLDFREWENNEAAFEREVNRLLQRLGKFSLTPFTFNTVTLDRRGKEIERRQLQARQFIEELAHSVTLEMVEIPGGTFVMGSPPSEENSFDDERPQHQVKVAPFYLGKFAVTQEQWRVIATDTSLKVKMDLNPEIARFKDKPDSARRPVEQVSWEEAQEFCARLAKKTGRAYRLPSETEWEYACRAGTTTPFAFGETIRLEMVNYDGKYPYQAPKGKSRVETVPVGSLGIANAWGLFDMHGNVWEWCEDVWHNNYDTAPTDGSAWTVGGISNRRILRGGGWDDSDDNCRSANRDDFSTDDRVSNIGFRVVVAARTPKSKP
jgi:formylglycine-generating enzyme required for sulfatase activity/tetratricopeptide (TPR) repeat protein